MSEAEIMKALIIYGPLGIMCAGLAVGYVQKDRDLKRANRDHMIKQEELQKNFLDKQENLMQKHQLEITTLQDRYISKSESYMDKYRELAQGQNAVIEALSKRKTG